MKNQFKDAVGGFLARHLNEAIREKFHMDLPEDLIELAHAFKRSGKPLYVVGGAVRDAIQGKQPHDYDVASAATPDEAKEILQRYLPSFKTLEFGEQFGIIKVITPLKGEYEIATFRKDLGAGRRPDAVEFTTIENDVQRRDLTINALFYDIDAEEIVDHVGGIEDIKNSIVRTVGDPASRFGEDKLRKLRVLRFAARMGSPIHGSTAEALHNDNSLTGVSPERIRDEFIKGIAAAKHVSQFLALVSEFHMWDQICPGLKMSEKPYEVRDPVILMALLLKGNDPAPLSKKLVVGMKWHIEEASGISFLIRLQALHPDNAFRLKKAFANASLSDDQMREFSEINQLPDRRLLEAFIKYQPSITGDELLAQGYKGKELGLEQERRETAEFRNLL